MKALLWLVGLPIGLFVAYVLVFMISEGVSDTQYYATSVGLSVKECRELSVRLGVRPDQADAKCSERVPKSRSAKPESSA